MSANDAHELAPNAAIPAANAPSVMPKWSWSPLALYLAGGAQLITIAAILNQYYPVTVTWSSVLLAAAPAPIVAIAAFAKAPANLAAAAIGIIVMVAGLAGQAAHTGPLFAPAIVALAIAAVKIRKEHAATPEHATPEPRSR